jgi:hypothetical protein
VGWDRLSVDSALNGVDDRCARRRTGGGQRLLVAKRQFELWRRGCRGPGRIPTELWVLAAKAAAELGIEGAPGECQVEIAEPSGRKLCISLKGSAVGQLASLLATLCGREVAP